jgi:hypothetical protein
MNDLALPYIGPDAVKISSAYGAVFYLRRAGTSAQRFKRETGE